MNYKGFHQLQWEDRLVIEKMLKVGDSKAKIAEALGVCKKTIYNEIKRGQYIHTCDWCDEVRYSADKGLDPADDL